MNRRLVVQVTCVFILGILFGTKRMWILPLILAGLILHVYIEHMQKKHRLRGTMKCMLLAGTFLISAIRLENEEKFRAAYENRLVDDDRTTIQGTVYKKESKNQNNLYYLNNSFIILESETVPCNRILVYLDTDEYQIGKTLIIEGKTKLFEKPGNEGQFDARRYYQNQKIDFIFYGEMVTAQHGQPKRLDNVLYLLKNKIRKVYENNCSAEDAGVLATMVLGDKSILDSELKQLYQESGISHILAISGLHISVIGMAVYRRLRKRRAGFLSSGILAGVLVYLYCTLSGMGTSSGRAFGMFFLLVTAPVFLRTYDSLTAMGITALLLLWKNPFMLYDSGFQFSYCAVLGVVVVGGRMVSCMEKRKFQRDRHAADEFMEKLRRKREGLWETVLISLGIQMMTLPLTLWNYYEFPLYSVLINLVILPFVGVVLGCGLFGGVIGLWYVIPARLPLFVSHLILKCYRLICEVVGAFPGSMVITGRPKLEWIFFYYAMLFAFCILLEGRKKVILTTVAVPFVLMLLSGKEKGFEVDVLDVGQGDGIFLSSEDNRSFFIDGGSTDVKNVGKYRILPFLKSKGRGKIDYWFVSHTDADHCNGLADVMENGYRVDHLVFSDKVPDDDSFRELVSMAEKKHTNVCYMAKGDSLHTENMNITCIYPDESNNETDKNALSMVLLVSDGDFSGIFTGDISESEEKGIAEMDEIENLDFYKSAHHGAGTSNSEEFLENMSPQVAVVSCGLNNSYGHPAPDAVMRMEKSGAEVYYTMWGGQISIWRNEDELSVQNYRSPLEVHTYPMLK